MTIRIARPADPYSPEWALFYEQNPHLNRSVGAAGDDGGDGGDSGDGGGASGETGGGDGGETGALPDSPDGYAFDVPSVDDLELPEGFNSENLQLQIKDDDPRIPALKELAHRHQMPQAAVNDLAKLWAQHEVNEMHGAAKVVQEEIGKLGDNAQSRLESLERIIRGRFREAQAEALLNDLTTAASIQAVEALLGRSTQPNGPQPGGKPNMGEMTIDERLTLAQERREAQRKRRR